MENLKTPPEGGEQQQVPEGSGVPEAEAKQPEGQVVVEETPKTLTQVDWDSRETNLRQEWDVKRQEHEAKHKEELDRLRTEHGDTIRQLQERETAEYLRQVEDAGGDVDVAKRLRDKETKLSDRERELGIRETQSNETLKTIDAHRFATQYGVDEKELLKAKNPVEMENIALRLQTDKLKAEATKLEGERKEAEKTPQHIDSGTPSGAGGNWREASSSEKIRQSLKDPVKK